MLLPLSFCACVDKPCFCKLSAPCTLHCFLHPALCIGHVFCAYDISRYMVAFSMPRVVSIAYHPSIACRIDRMSYRSLIAYHINRVTYRSLLVAFAYRIDRLSQQSLTLSIAYRIKQLPYQSLIVYVVHRINCSSYRSFIVSIVFVSIAYRTTVRWLTGGTGGRHEA